MGPNHKPNQQNVKSEYTNMNFLIISIIFGSLNSSPLVSEFLYFFVFVRTTKITYLAANNFSIRLLLIWFQGLNKLLKTRKDFDSKFTSTKRYLFDHSARAIDFCDIILSKPKTHNK